MKISKLLKFLLGMSGFFQFNVDDADAGGALEPHEAASGFEAFLGDDGDDKEDGAAPAGETPEAAAERLLAAEAAAKEAGAQQKDPAADAGDKVTIEVDGKTVELTKAELAEHYKNGLRQADYTQKTMQAAEVRKTADAEVAKTRQERDSYAEKLNHFAIKLQGDLHEQSRIDWPQLLATDPMEYLNQKRIADERQAHLAQAQQELSNIQVQQQNERAETERANTAAQHQALLDKLPDWKDPEKAKVESNQIKDYLMKNLGYAPEDFKTLSDHRQILTARKAMLYDALIERASTATKKVAALPQKVERPGTAADTGRADARTEAVKRAARTGSVDDAAAAFEHFLT